MQRTIPRGFFAVYALVLSLFVLKWLPLPTVEEVDTPHPRIEKLAVGLTAWGATYQDALPIAKLVNDHATKHNLNPWFVVGVIGVENPDLKPTATSYAGAKGIMQIMPFWKKHFGNKCGEDLEDTETNICMGTFVLKEHLRGVPERKGLLRYNGCVKNPTCGSYPDKVYSRMRSAMSYAYSKS